MSGPSVHFNPERERALYLAIDWFARRNIQPTMEELMRTADSFYDYLTEFDRAYSG